MLPPLSATQGYRLCNILHVWVQKSTRRALANSIGSRLDGKLWEKGELLTADMGVVRAGGGGLADVAVVCEKVAALRLDVRI